MSVSNVFYERISFLPTIPTLPQFRKPHQENHFDGQNIIIRDSHESLVRASTFIHYLERNLHIAKESKSPLQTLLERSLHLPALEENELFFSEITHAFFKEEGYFSRLFSNESWKEWFENRTALGKVASQYRNCIESRAEVSSFTKEIDPQLIQKADEEASVLLKGLGIRETARISKSSCLYGLTGGVAASILLKNPFLLLLGMSECFPRAHAQQKVGNEFQVNTYTSSDQSASSVASFSNGNFVVTWQSNKQDGSEEEIYCQLFDGNGSNVGGEFRANSYTTSFQWVPSVTSFSNGNFVVTWQSWLQDGSWDGIYGQLFDGNGFKIRAEFRANSYTTSDQDNPSAASFPNDNFVVTWNSYDQDGSSSGVYGQLFNGNGSEIGNEFRANSFTTNAQWFPSVASFPNGNFVVTWQSEDQDGSGNGVYGQLFGGNGTKIGSEFQVNTYMSSDQWQPSVASLVDGNFVVTWQSEGQDGSGYGVYGQLFDGNGSKIGGEFQVNTYMDGYQLGPSAASLVDGNFVVTWDSFGQDGSSSGVYGQLFDGNGSKIGGEFQVNTYMDGYQSGPSAASLVDGNFVVTWQSEDQDGSGYGIYGQVFHDNITYPSSSTTTSSSTTSTTKTTFSTVSRVSSNTTSSTKTTSSTTPSVSSSTMSATGRTRTSVNPSSSRTTVSSTTRPTTISNSRATLSATSDPSNRFSWVWFLLGGAGAVSCLGLTGYFIFKSRDRKKDIDVLALELGEREQTDDSTVETHYQRTPDVVAAVCDYQFTPNVVAAGAEEEPLYGLTPDVVAARDGGN